MLGDVSSFYLEYFFFLKIILYKIFLCLYIYIYDCNYISYKIRKVSENISLNILKKIHFISIIKRSVSSIINKSSQRSDSDKKK